MPAHPSRDGHWLEGHMHEVNENAIEEVFTWDAPSNQQLVLLGLEEMRGNDRANVYRLLARWKGRR